MTNTLRPVTSILGVTMACFCCASSRGRAQSPGLRAPTAVSVCEVLSKPLAFDGRIVTISGVEEGTDEGLWLAGDCPTHWVTEGQAWPSVIALTMPNVPAPLRIHSVDFKFDIESERRLKLKLESLLAAAPKKCIAFTYTGLFETREDWSRARLTYPDGTSKLAGFGHLGEAPGQLLLKSADDVSLMPNCADRAAGR